MLDEGGEGEVGVLCVLAHSYAFICGMYVCVCMYVYVHVCNFRYLKKKKKKKMKTRAAA